MKKTVVFLTLMVALLGCNQAGTEKKNQTDEQSLTEISIHDLLANPEQYVDKKVAIAGTIDHVCRRTGKKMFMIGDDPADRIKITPDNKIGTFEVDLEGSTYTVIGVFQELIVDEKYLAMMEEDEAKAGEGAENADHDSPLDQGLHNQEEEQNEEVKPASQVMREQLEASGKDHLSFYSVEATELKEKQ